MESFNSSMLVSSTENLEIRTTGSDKGTPGVLIEKYESYEHERESPQRYQTPNRSEQPDNYVRSSTNTDKRSELQLK